jgi:EAL domain-containing protein (putative c-di-GMP-specific phosphodiesterase class I)
VVKRILENMAKPLTIDGNEIFLSCSAGISLFPHDTEDPEMLLAHASSARYNAKKRAGSNKFSFFADEVDQTSNRHLWLEGQLHNALEKGEFSLHYQPKVNLSSGLITGMEGLIRWNHPKLGNVSPVDFIPVAERSGLINDIGRWVLETGCAQSRQWADAGFPDVVIAVNVSALQLRQEDLCEQISGALERNDLRPAMLELEVTESAVMENFEESIAVLKKITATGVHIAIDDFGTGYSSLAYLKHMPAHTLKIDRSFLSDTVPDEQDKLIITAIIAMAHSMKLSVVAEGVETDTQRSFLKALECDEMQGYLFSKPVSGEASLALLKHHDDTNSNAATTRKIA